MLQSNIDDVRQVSSAAGNQVFRVRCGDRVAFLKVARELDLRREVAVLEALHKQDVPVPVIEAFDATGDTAGAPCLLLRHVGGRPLTGVEPVLRTAGAHLRAVHDIKLDGFGSLVVHGPIRGEDLTWADTVRRRTTRLEPIIDAGLIDADLVARAGVALEKGQQLFDAVPSGRLLHGDFHPRHVYASDERITGIIDWGDATSGDPVYDLGRVLHSGVLDKGLEHGFALVQVVVDGYGDAPWIRRELTAKLLLYAAVFVMWSMEGEFSGGAPWAPWWPAQNAALSLILDRVSRT